MNRVAKLHFHLHPFVLVIIAGFGNRHLEYFIQDIDGDVFDRVSTLVRVNAHPGKILSQNFCNCKKATIYFAD